MIHLQERNGREKAAQVADKLGAFIAIQTLMNDKDVKVVARIEVTQGAKHDCAMSDIVIIDVANNDHGLAFSLLILTGTCVAPLHPGRFDPP